MTYHTKFLRERQLMRLDSLLVERGLAPSRSKATALIKDGHVMVPGVTNPKKIKPSLEVADDADVTVTTTDMGYVSRGAEKLKAILPATGFDFKHKVVLDIGASTGGFTQLSLEEGAQQVFAVDVGTGQLADALKNDPKVVNLEKTDARNLSHKDIPTEPHVLLCDVSFISSTRILPHVLATFPSISDVFVLVKPQFELTQQDVGKGGIVRSKERQLDALESVKQCLQDCGFETPTFVKAPQAKQTKNQEFILHGRKPA